MTTPEEFVNVVNALYHRQEAQIRSEAEKWLVEFQKKVEAWSVCDSILRTPNLPYEAYIVAAQTLRMKLEYNYSDLPSIQSRISFRDALSQHIMTFSVSSKDGHSLVRKQLCICVATLVILMEEWHGALEELSKWMANRSELALSLLDILIGVPDVCHRGKVYLPAGRRDVVKRELVSFGPRVLELLHIYDQASRDNVSIQSKLFDCFREWLRWGVCDANSVINHVMFERSFGAMNNPQLFEEACGVIFTLLKESSDIQKFGPLVSAMFPKVLSLSQQYDAALLQQDEDVCKRLCVLFTEMGTSYLPLLMSASPQAHQTLELILKCTAHPQVTISKETFPFWYRLARGISTLKNNEQRVQRIRAFTPLFSQLVMVLKGAMTYPQDYQTWSDEDRQDYKKYRYLAAETLMDALLVISTAQVLRVLYEATNADLNKYRNDPNQWHPLEACLYCIRSIARKAVDESKVDATVKELLPWFMSILTQCDGSSALKYTAILIIGRYADWLNKNPQQIPTLVDFVAKGMNDSETLSAATLAFKHVCDACPKHMVVVWSDLMAMYTSMSNKMLLPDQKEIIEALTLVCLELPLDQVVKGLEQMITPIASDIMTVVQASQAGTQGVCNLTNDTLDRLAHIFQIMQKSLPRDPERHRCIALGTIEMLQKLWPLLDSVLKFFQGKDSVMERLCRCWKYAIKSTGIHFQPFLIPLVQTLSDLYKNNPHSSFLYVASICVQTFGPHQHLHQVLVEIFSVFSTQTLPKLTNKQCFVNNPDIAEDFFDLMRRFLTYCPMLLLSHPLLDSVVKCGLEGLVQDEKQAQNAVSDFYITLLRLGNPPRQDMIGQRDVVPNIDNQMNRAAVVEVLQRVLTENGQTLVNRIVECVAGGLPNKHRLRFTIELIDELLIFCKPEAERWFYVALQAVPETQDPDKGTFYQNLFNTQNPAERKRRILDFDEAARRVIGKVH